MKIFQPIVTGSLSTSGSVFFPSLVTSSTTVSNVVMFGTSGQLFVTASSAIGGAGSGFPFSGSAVITGSLLVSGSGLAVTGSSNLNGTLRLGPGLGTISSPGDGTLTIAAQTANAYRIQVTANEYVYVTTPLGVIMPSAQSFFGYGAFRFTTIGGSQNVTTGIFNQFVINDSFAPTTGTGVYNAINLSNTISQSAAATGISRALLINPTLTSAKDFRAVEWTNNASATSGSWGLYGSGSAPNYLSGSLSIGTTVTGSNALTVSGSTNIIGGPLTVTGSVNVNGNSTLNGTVSTGNQVIVGGASSTAGILNFFNANVGIGRTGASGLDFRVGSNAVAATIFSTTNVLIQSGGTHTDDAINRLQVSGSVRISQALTASQALISGSGTQRLIVVGSGSAQPLFTVQGSQGELFSIVDSLSGSLFSVNDQSGLPIMEIFSDNTTLVGNYLAPMLLTTNRTSSAVGINTIYRLPTSSYDAVYLDYTIRSGSNARAGNFMAMWSGSSVNFTDNSITEFGSTSTFTFGAHVSGANMVVTGSAPTTGWTIKTIIKAI